MTTGAPPVVVIVDDEDQGAFAATLEMRGVEAHAVEPGGLERPLLERATLVLVDQYLERFPERDGADLPLALRVPDGLSLAAVLRAHVEGTGGDSTVLRRPVSFALRSGNVALLGAGIPAQVREHLIAARYHLDWVFDKGAGREPTSPAARVAELALATQALPAEWGPNSGDPGRRWLALPDLPWNGDAVWQIEQCRPPQHLVAASSAGREWLRWFLHRILPFPTFLLDRTHLAAALGVTPGSVGELLDGDGSVVEALDAVRYRGPLARFAGERWWRAGVAHLVGELVEDEHGDRRLVGEAVARAHGSGPVPVEVADPVVGINADYETLPELLSAADAVRLQPDAWPVYADDPWADRALLDGDDADLELRALVVAADRWRIGGGDPDR